jgi:hypothetical protein
LRDCIPIRTFNPCKGAPDALLSARAGRIAPIAVLVYAVATNFRRAGVNRGVVVIAVRAPAACFRPAIQIHVTTVAKGRAGTLRVVAIRPSIAVVVDCIPTGDLVCRTAKAWEATPASGIFAIFIAIAIVIFSIAAEPRGILEFRVRIAIDVRIIVVAIVPAARPFLVLISILVADCAERIRRTV